MNIVSLQSFRNFVHFGEIGANLQRDNDDVACISESGEVTRDAACASWHNRKYHSGRDDVSSSLRRNNDIRQKFLEALIDAYGTGEKRGFACLPSYIRKALKGTWSSTQSGDFGLETDLGSQCGFKVTSGKPLTARRIRKVFEAIDAEKRKAVLQPHQDPTSTQLMRQSQNAGLCYVNSIINVLKQRPEGRAHLSNLFGPNGCTLYVSKSDAGTRATRQESFKYGYSKSKKYQLGMQGEAGFSPLERTMLHHARSQQGNVMGGGNPNEGAQMLGLGAMSKAEAWPYSETNSQKGAVNKIKQHLAAGHIVIWNTGGHYVAITGIREDDEGKERCHILDDVDSPGIGQSYERYASDIARSFSSNDFYVILPPENPVQKA